ncbi:MarR family transcriptional regulator [Paenibacillus baekrokdamisoli]|uniref:MarR family transcriptional regulator n=1 Tax=Paenibacillus baekrokdamisoli TaxID=1712516 RepID=A0A3G9J3C0_9BACL|nr:MarR family transcriptional regulator [Paenibacillus baekrokdamisoli]MBB3068101.1 DNA-binding MarR family transcriptional regulator [Paenibacillus baekrokdamisoli]BBH22855.1 MarR family transcriptional regulator [Paenibacillus baekrokdamisoli]
MAYNVELISLAGLFRTLLKSMKQEWNKHGTYSLSFTQFKVLFKLQAEGAQKVSELAEAMGMTPGAITGIADKLIAEGYIKRSRAEDDRRVVYIELTDKGERMLKQLLISQAETMSTFFDKLPDEDIAHLTRIFKRMLE